MIGEKRAAISDLVHDFDIDYDTWTIVEYYAITGTDIVMSPDEYFVWLESINNLWRTIKVAGDFSLGKQSLQYESVLPPLQGVLISCGYLLTSVGILCRYY